MVAKFFRHSGYFTPCVRKKKQKTQTVLRRFDAHNVLFLMYFTITATTTTTTILILNVVEWSSIYCIQPTSVLFIYIYFDTIYK